MVKSVKRKKGKANLEIEIITKLLQNYYKNITKPIDICPKM